MIQILSMIIALNLSPLLFAQTAKKKFVYKKHETFSFDSIDVAAGESAPGDISVSPRFRRNLGYKLPERKHFNDIMIKEIDLVK